MNNKVKTCKFNANRHAYEIAHPYCVYVSTLNVQLPPHVFFVNREGIVEEQICKKCKCYQPAEESLTKEQK